MAGLTIGVAFGMGAIGSIVIGMVIDKMGIHFSMNSISILTLLLLIAFLLPRDRAGKPA